MNKILVLTTEGCEACTIAEANVKNAIKQSDKKIVVCVSDWKEVSRDFIRDNNIKDFPAVIYLIGKTVVNKTYGTYPQAVYLRWIDMYF